MSKLVLLASCLVVACGADESQARISGLVVDHAGRPLPGANVSIEQSAYKATSGPDGRYTIPFAPGTFKVVYTMDGMTRTSVEHSIQGEVAFPAADIQLYPKPAEAGVYLLTDDGPKKLERAELDKQTLSSGWYSSERKYFCTGEGGLSTTAGKVRFIDSSPATMLPAKAGGYGLLLHEKGEETPFNGVFQDAKEYVGDDRLVVRSFDVEPGNYAFVTFGEEGRSGRKIDPEAGCLPFKVQ